MSVSVTGQPETQDDLAPRTTSFRALADELSRAVSSAEDEPVQCVRSNARRNALLAEYREKVHAQMVYDADLNLRELAVCYRALRERGGLDRAEERAIADLFERLKKGAACLRTTGIYADPADEDRCSLAVLQFYLDALLLADALTARETGRRPLRASSANGWCEMSGLSAPGRIQAIKNTLELGVPDLLTVNLIRTALPTVLLDWMYLLPTGKVLRYADFEQSTLGWTRHGGFNQLRSLEGRVIRWVGKETFRASDELFERPGGRTRHNVILTMSHRLGFLDIPLLIEVVRGIRCGLWVNTAAYPAGMARKFREDPLVVPVRGDGALAPGSAFKATRDLLIQERVPVGIVADGAQPHLMYGYQPRLKPGVRLAADVAIRASAGTGRKTYVVPISLNDPVGYVRGQQDEIVVTVHKPILVETRFARRKATNGANPVNEGDDLLNHLEALFLVNTAHARFGLRSPRVLAAARQRRRMLSRRGGLRPWIESRFPPTLLDLSRTNAAPVT